VRKRDGGKRKEGSAKESGSNPVAPAALPSAVTAASGSGGDPFVWLLAGLAAITALMLGASYVRRRRRG
jgi:hypothetical protein